jgi:hypothetical protein
VTRAADALRVMGQDKNSANWRPKNVPKVKSLQMIRWMARLALRALVAALVVALLAVAIQYWRERRVREALYTAFTPVKITNCTLQRFGNTNDGGYLMCANLMADAQSGYSYGINGEDAWGCDVTARTRIPIHQYDCFNTQEPACPGGQTRFHAECVGPERAIIEDRPFDTIANQLVANGDNGKRLIVKMDVEGSEWRSLAGAPDHVLDAIDQMAVEFHDVDEPHFLDTAARLNQFFYVAHIHQNNYECRPGYDPFPGPVFEALFVNKRIAEANPSVIARGPSPLDAPNASRLPDCQESPGGSEPERLARWLRRSATAAFNAISARLPQ